MRLRSVAVLLSLVLKVESNWELEIKLHGTALMGSLKGIEDLDVNLGSVEGTISWVFLPGLSKAVQGLSKSSLGLVPHGIVSKFIFGSG